MKKGLRLPALAIRSLVALLAIMLLPVILYPFLSSSRYTSGSDPLRMILGDIYLVDLGTAVIFIILAFILLARQKLLEIKPEPWIRWQVILFSCIGLTSLVAYLLLRRYSSLYPLHVWSSPWITYAFAAGILFSLSLLLISVIFASFNVKHIKTIASRCRGEIALSVIFFAGYLFITKLIKSFWLYLSNAVAVCDFLLLDLVGDATFRSRWPDDPLLGINGFIVSIGKDCSGIDSMAMFTALYLLIFAVEWQKLNKKRMLAIFLPGLVGMFLMNVLRIFLLMIAGILVSPSFAVGLFHSNAGWLLFVLYFILFWYLLLPWVKK
jgi:uncharacterized protein